jgi:hypothetical protein
MSMEQVCTENYSVPHFFTIICEYKLLPEKIFQKILILGEKKNACTLVCIEVMFVIVRDWKSKCLITGYQLYKIWGSRTIEKGQEEMRSSYILIQMISEIYCKELKRFGALYIVKQEKSYTYMFACICCVVLFCFVCSTGVWLRVSCFATQLLYHLRHTSSTVLFLRLGLAIYTRLASNSRSS